MPLERPTGILEKSGWGSPLAAGQGFLGWERFREPELADHWLKSDPARRGVPLGWEPFVAMVVLDEAEETEDDEFERESCLRGANMPLASSGFMGLLPLMLPHAGREIWGKVGGLATAVMGKAQTRLGGSSCRWRAATHGTGLSAKTFRRRVPRRPCRPLRRPLFFFILFYIFIF